MAETITYAPIGSNGDAQIHLNGRHVGLLLKDRRPLGVRYAILLNDDPLGLFFVRDRSLVTEAIAERIASHPDLPSYKSTPTLPAAPGLPF